MSRKQLDQAKLDDTILMPTQWEGYPLQTILKQLSKIKINGKSIIPTYYSKGAKDWNTFDIS